jgi:hypothetical protein
MLFINRYLYKITYGVAEQSQQFVNLKRQLLVYMSRQAITTLDAELFHLSNKSQQHHNEYLNQFPKLPV